MVHIFCFFVVSLLVFLVFFPCLRNWFKRFKKLGSPCGHEHVFFKAIKMGGLCCFSLPIFIFSCIVFIIILWPVTGSSGVVDHLDTDGNRLSAVWFTMPLACYPRTGLVSSTVASRGVLGAFYWHFKVEQNGPGNNRGEYTLGVV